MTTDDESAFDRLRADVDRPLTRLFREYGASRTRWLALGLVANLLAQAASLVPPVVLGTAIDAVFGSQTTAYALPFAPASWIPATPEAQFWFSAWLIVGAFAVTAVCTWVYGVTANVFAHDVMHAVRTDSFEKLVALDMQFFDDKQTGEVMAILNNDAGNLEVFLDNALMNSLRLVVMVGGIAFILFSMNRQLAVVTLVVVPGLVGFTLWFMRAVAPRYRARQSAIAAFNTRIENAIGGVELVKTTNSESFESGRVRNASSDVYETTMSVLKLSYLYRPGMELLAGLSFAATFVVGGYWLLVGAPGPLSGGLTVGTFVTFIFLTQRFVAPLAEVSNIVDQVQNARASAERVFGLADIPARVVTRPDAVELSNPEGRVEYDGVSFSYSEPTRSDGGAERSSAAHRTQSGDGDASADAGTRQTGSDGGAERSSAAHRTQSGDGDASADAEDELVVEDVSLLAEPGDTVAFVGPTGAGKSTLAKLLLRLYDPTAGSVRLDGRDVRDVTLSSLRGAVGYVSQDTHLFDGTIAENVRYGRFGVTEGVSADGRTSSGEPSDEAVRDAAKAAEAHEFIAGMPDGYETRVGERGVKLSGGQRQRVALARAVLHDPPVLVLDEATSAVDTETERAIQRSLDRLAADRTTFVIAHRLSTVVDADEILVLEDGVVVERGTHGDLLAADGRYASLWRAQTNASER